MKYAYLFLAIFLCVTLNAQIIAEPSKQNDEIILEQILTSRSESVVTMKLLTTEIIRQWHDGQEVFKTIRDVEYTLKETEKKITRKRKVLSSKTEKVCLKEHVLEVFPDMTNSLLSGILSSKTVRKDGEGYPMPCAINRDTSQGRTIILLDKLSLMKSKGIDTVQDAMGTLLKYEVMTEELRYGSLADLLFFDQLKGVKTKVELTSTEKSGIQHLVKVEEDIQIQSISNR